MFLLTPHTYPIPEADTLVNEPGIICHIGMGVVVAVVVAVVIGVVVDMIEYLLVTGSLDNCIISLAESVLLNIYKF